MFWLYIRAFTFEAKTRLTTEIRAHTHLKMSVHTLQTHSTNNVGINKLNEVG